MAGPSAPIAQTGTSPLATLGWGFYLAVSWTWVIGMILPALMLRDFGWWGLAVFLAPNAIGAAAMGTVLRNGDAARRMRLVHDAAIRRFSMVTIAFHLYVLGAIGLAVEGFHTIPGQLGVLAFGAIAAVALLALRRWLLTALLVWVASVGLGVAYAISAETGWAIDWSATSSGPSRDLLMLAPVVVFGFALCPYLDATFLRARAATSPAAGKVAFAFGFLGPFVVMIAFTALYAGAIVSGHATSWVLVLVHMALQAGFTLAVHLREAKLSIAERGLTLGLTIAAMAGALALPVGPIAWADGMLAWEVIYRLFMSAYGLFFPAYVLYAMMPTALSMGPMTRGARAVTTITMAAVLPMYALGFIAREEQWLPLAFGLVLAGAFVTFIMRRRAAERSDG
ncbi:hypothetical protein AY599_00725 [Leptolyngbya valderiana BDU 20041]|nr:hypothetical protein AY599_00725 [Leptolyngbya valderiana BDU 20041]